MPETRWDPFRELVALQEKMNRLFDQTLSRSGSEAQFAASGTWSPSVDIYESKEDLVLQAELPEVDQDDIELRIDNTLLTLKGQRRMKEAVKEEQFHRMERAFGPFSRTFTLPSSVDAQKARAEFKKGILKVTMPKRADAVSTQIRINVRS